MTAITSWPVKKAIYTVAHPKGVTGYTFPNPMVLVLVTTSHTLSQYVLWKLISAPAPQLSEQLTRFSDCVND